jgi:hypothetical protein
MRRIVEESLSWKLLGTRILEVHHEKSYHDLKEDI